jgi:hypothetical protein
LRCDCGTLFRAASRELNGGQTKSCGCLKVDTGRQRVTHGATVGGKITREYRIWSGVKNRCLNPNNPSYPNYGGRGIALCEAWMSFETFFKDMGTAPSPRHSLGRVDNNGDYSPENCRWETAQEQARNSRRTRWITHKGLTLSLCEWASRIGITSGALHLRLKRGWSIDTALAP